MLLQLISLYCLFCAEEQKQSVEISPSVRPSDSEDDPSMRNFEEADANVFFIEQKYKGVK